MDDRIMKSLSDNWFYLIAFLVSLGLMFFLPAIVAPTTAVIYGTGNPGFFEQFLTELELPLSEMSSTTLSIYALTQFAVSLIIAILFIIVLRKRLINDFKEFKRDLWYNLLSIVLWFIVITAISVGMVVLFELLKIEGTAENQEGVEALMASKLGFLMLISTVLLAPFIEEIIFRKFLFGLFEKTFRFPIYIATILSAVIFGLIHDYTIFFFMYFPLALVLSLSYSLYKNNIFMPMGVHLLNNVFAVIMMVLVF
ncbi:MAG: CPBP family intramembrane metalloprotease [Bacilli bacterium]|nr:CPBP family intramembrane metalloprotease [Bacilli bacterium]MDD4077210.1 type II CAAX endopeptidase family protein [Bacilli bacterium]MDD4387668.1 type II CAAX endopeptidase family protein [Bacilli bacterium]